MNKVTKEDFIQLRDKFKIDNNITDNNFNTLSTLKFYKSTFLKDFYDLSLLKTDLEEAPIAISYSSNKILVENSLGTFFDPHVVVKKADIDDDVYEIAREIASLTNSQKPVKKNPFNYTFVLHDEDKELVNTVNTILENSESFKDFISNLNNEFGNEFHSRNLPSISRKLPVIKLLDSFNSFKNIMDSNSVDPSNIKYYSGLIIDLLETDIPTNNLSSYNFERKFYETYIAPYETYVNLMDDYYKEFEPYFDLYKLKQSLMLGMMHNAKSEEELLNAPELNNFIEFLKIQSPSWFNSLDDSITQLVIDDNTIRKSGIAVADLTADFNLIEQKNFMVTATPNLTDGYNSIPRHYMNNTYNYTHIAGDNQFFKMYYHNLCIEQRDNLKVCFVIDSELSFSIPREERIKYIRPILDYLQENKIVLHLDHQANSSLFHNVQPEEFVKLIASDYPNLLSLYRNDDFLKAISILEAKSYEEAFEIYKSKDDGTTIRKTLKNKI